MNRVTLLTLLLATGCQRPAALPPVAAAVNYRAMSAGDLQQLLKEKAAFEEVTLKKSGETLFTGTAKSPDGTAFTLTVTVEVQSVKYTAKNAAGTLVGTITPNDHKQDMRLNP